MALKPATDFRLDAPYQFTVVQITPKRDGLGADAAQKTTPEGVPVWTVDALRSAAGETDLISVSVPSPSQPTVSGPAAFKNMRLGLWLGEKSRQGGLYWQADAIAPSTPAQRRES